MQSVQGFMRVHPPPISGAQTRRLPVPRCALVHGRHCPKPGFCEGSCTQHRSVPWRQGHTAFTMGPHCMGLAASGFLLQVAAARLCSFQSAFLHAKIGGASYAAFLEPPSAEPEPAESP